MGTETLDRLYLELSQFTTAKTERELRMEEHIEKLETNNHRLRRAVDFLHTTMRMSSHIANFPERQEAIETSIKSSYEIIKKGGTL